MSRSPRSNRPRFNRDAEGYGIFDEMVGPGEGDEDEVHWPVIEYDTSVPSPTLRLDRDPLVVWAEHTGIPVEFWKELGVRSLEDRYIAFTWPQGWQKVRDVTLRVDAKTKQDKILRRFYWTLPPGNNVKPLWPHMQEGEHTVIWLTEGESDCAVLRYIGLDAYTFGSATAVPGDIELRLLEKHGVQRAVLVFDADSPGYRATEKMGAALARHGIEAIPLDLGPVLIQWDYLKDVRDLFGQLDRTALTSVLNELLEEELSRRDEDLSAAARLRNVQSPEWIWHSLAAKACLVMLYGQAKGGKTLLCYHLIKQMGKGGDLLGQTVKTQRVLYYSEMPLTIDKSRADRILLGSPEDAEVDYDKEEVQENLAHFFMRSSSDEVFQGLTWPQIVMLMEKDCRKYQIDYVIVDTVNEWMRFQEVGGMYDPVIVANQIRLLRRLTAVGITVQINHHPPKGGGSPLGSVVFQAAVDCLLELESKVTGPGQTAVELTAIGRLRGDFDKALYKMEGPYADIKMLEKTKEGEAPIGSLREALLAAIPESPDYIDFPELMTDPLISQSKESVVRSRLKEMEDKGEIIGTTGKPKMYSRPRNQFQVGGLTFERT